MHGRGLGGLLRAHRLAAGLTQRELAAQAGVGVRTVRNLELDEIADPRPLTLSRIAGALALSGNERDALLAASGTVPSWPRVGILGPLSVTRDDRPVELRSAKQRTLLGLLALHPGDAVSRADIVDVLWGDHPPKTCRSLVRDYAGGLRAALGPDVPAIASVGGGYRLDAADVDLARFQALAEDAAARHTDGDPSAALDRYGRALTLWRGPLLADADPRLREHPAAASARQRHVAVASAAAALALAEGRPHSAVEWLRALLSAEPWHEGLHARLMLALAAAGEQAEALSLYAEFRGRLADDLGVDPGPELTEAHARVLRGEPASTPPAPVQGPVPAQLPASPAAFIGRDEFLAGLDAALPAAGAGTPVVVISGTAGVGKSALAVHWGHAHRGDFPGGQLYVNLRGFDPGGAALLPGEAIRGFLDALGVPAERIPADLGAQSALLRGLLAERRVLVLLDNARDTEQVRPLLPGAPGCLTLVTSRDRLSGLAAADGAVPLTLDLLTRTEARDLLTRRLGASRVGAEPDAVDELIDLCARLPLALVIVAAHAATSTGVTLADLAAELRGTGGTLDALDAGDAHTDLRRVFSWSYRTLRPGAAALFRALGVHTGPDITAAAAAALAGRASVRAELAGLTGASLLEEYVPGRYRFHDLLRAYAADLAAADGADVRHDALHRILDHYLLTGFAAALRITPSRKPVSLAPVLPGRRPEDLADHDDAIAWFTAEHQVLLRMIDVAAAEGFDEHVWRLAWTMTHYFDRGGHWRDWIRVQAVAVESAGRIGDVEALARALHAIGSANLRLGRHEEARGNYLRALDGYRELGDTHSQANAELDLGFAYGHEGRHRDAVPHTRNSLDLYQRAGSAEGEANALNNLAWHFNDLGEDALALEHAERALVLYRRLDDPDGEASTWDTLGTSYGRLGDHGRAMDCFERALDGLRHRGDVFEQAGTLLRIGDTHLALGDPDAAARAWRTALEIYTDLGHAEAEQARARLRTTTARAHDPVDGQVTT